MILDETFDLYGRDVATQISDELICHDFPQAGQYNIDLKDCSNGIGGAGT